MLIKNVDMDKKDWAAWARLCKRFPEIKKQLDHCAALMAAQSVGAINVRTHIGKTIGGWKATVIGYSPRLVGHYQNFNLNSDPQYPKRFPTLEEATLAVVAEAKNLLRALQ